MSSLPIPPLAETDPKSYELVRVWAAHGEQHVALATEIWDDPAAWGIMLVDLAKHIGKAYELNGQFSRIEALRRIKEGFEIEWESWKDEPDGELLD